MSGSTQRSVHDNLVYGFTVDCERKRIVLYTEFRDGEAEEYTDVIFGGALAHHFQDVLASNILFGIEEVDVEKAVQEWKQRFVEGRPYGWPEGVEYREIGELVTALRERGLKSFYISSSYGMGGFVLAREMRISARESKAELQ